MIKRILRPSTGLLVLLLAPLWIGRNVPSAQAFQEVGAVTLSVQSGGLTSVVIDTANAFGYFGSSTVFYNSVFNSSYTIVSQVNLNTFAPTAQGLTLPRAPFIYSSAALDPRGGFAYFGGGTVAPGVVKVSLINFPTTISSTTLGPTLGGLSAAVVDSNAGFIYFGTQNTPAVVVKMSLTDLTVVSSVTLQTGFNNIASAVIDPTGGFAYFGSSTTPGMIAKINLSAFTVDSILTLNASEDALTSAVIDPAHAFAYFGTNDSPGKVIRVSVASFTRAAAITFLAGQNSLTSAVIDPVQEFAYFGANTSPGIVSQVSLNSFTETQSVTLNAGENFLTSAGVDLINEFAYFGTDTNPGKVVKLDLFPNLPAILTQPVDQSISVGQTATFNVVVQSRPPSYQWQVNGVAIPGANAASYTTPVTTLADNGNIFTCVITNANGSTTSRGAVLTVVPVVNVFPNPWRVDRHAGAKITFSGLPAGSTIKIFTLSGHWIKSLGPVTGTTTWDLTNDANEKVASGYYFYLILTSDSRQTVKGKIGVIQ